MREFRNVVLILKYRDDDLLHPGTEMVCKSDRNGQTILFLFSLTKDIGINVSTGDMVQQVSTVLVLLANLRNSLFFSLDEKYPLVTEVTRPVCVDLGQV